MVLTGGAVKVEGVVDLAESVFNMPVRIGGPQQVVGMDNVINNPIYSTSVGLLLYGLQQQTERRRPNGMLSHGLGGVWNRMSSWFQGNF